MFQYAMGRAYAIMHGKELVLDVSEFKKNKNRKLLLDQLEIKIKTIGALNNFLLFFYRNSISRLLIRVFGLGLFREKSQFKYDSKLIQSNVCYLDGYWQSYKYFDKYFDIIRSEIAIKHLNSHEYDYYLKLISAHKSVSLHVRRGDYISNLDAYRYHGLCDINYYTEAIHLIKNKIGDANYFIFSDDLQWCKREFIGDEFTFVEIKECENQALYELFLMSKCQHNIIANSTFSWWGAWLNNYNEKMVIYPLRWNKSITYGSDDLFPNNWVGIG